RSGGSRRRYLGTTGLAARRRRQCTCRRRGERRGVLLRRGLGDLDEVGQALRQRLALVAGNPVLPAGDAVVDRLRLLLRLAVAGGGDGDPVVVRIPLPGATVLALGEQPDHEFEPGLCLDGNLGG